MRCTAVLLLLAACGSPAAEPPDAMSGPPDAAHMDDGPPMRVQCTDQLGSALTVQHGRLDGFLRAIVGPGFGPCNADDTHLHLQVEADGATYDVAINVSDPQDIDYLAIDHAMVDGPWVEGWHPDQAALLDYPTTLGVHSGDFAATAMDPLVTALDDELATANHVSVFMTAYGTDGGHEVHRRGSGLDG